MKGTKPEAQKNWHQEIRDCTFLSSLRSSVSELNRNLKQELTQLTMFVLYCEDGQR